MSSSVLYDVPGPRAVARNRVIGAATIVVVAAVVGFLVWRLAVTGQFSAEKWNAFTYTRIWEQFLLAAGRTLAAFAAAAVGALILGFVLAIGRLSDHAWLRWPVGAVVEFLRAVPVLVMMFLLYYGLPVVGVRMEGYWVVVVALILYNGSVLAEVIRAGVESLPRGQSEAGYALGLTKSGVMRLVLLPQAIRAMMPVILAQLVVTLKDTALGFIITYEELLFYAKYLGSQNSLDRPIVQATLVAGAIYIGLCLALSGVARLVEKRLGRVPKSSAGPARPVQETTDTELIAAQRGLGKFNPGAGGGGGRL
ncbi:amino acid ABC transporter permease [Microbacterium sp. CnD16-F]|uniref:amino acid ABC transporter permease n=1 Tax=Microbacterium sp. CnD16-F TaxID=2954493 RepID=UPI002096E988|nr:amino acid ABC transporter permease [Microbacterium sp. CnD16-F]MCO7203677.1 amino acid ABC transporter permease [Microbacterium sp. CnD16-F]